MRIGVLETDALLREAIEKGRGLDLGVVGADAVDVKGVERDEDDTRHPGSSPVAPNPGAALEGQGGHDDGGREPSPAQPIISIKVSYRCPLVLIALPP